MGTPLRLCVYCGSRDGSRPAYLQAAERIGTSIGRRGWHMVYGGGRVGLMGRVADAALAAGASVTGVIPESLMRREVGHMQLTELQVVDTMHQRKQTMFQRSDAFAILPGGPGTLDETFEILTWRQIRLHDKPVVICNLGGYWNKLIELIEMIIAEKYVRPDFRDFYTVVDRIEEILPAVEAARAPTIPARVRKM